MYVILLHIVLRVYRYLLYVIYFTFLRVCRWPCCLYSRHSCCVTGVSWEIVQRRRLRRMVAAPSPSAHTAPRPTARPRWGFHPSPGACHRHMGTPRCPGIRGATPPSHTAQEHVLPHKPTPSTPSNVWGPVEIRLLFGGKVVERMKIITWQKYRIPAPHPSCKMGYFE